MAAGDTLRRITQQDQLVLDSSGNLVGLKNPNAGGSDLRLDPAFVAATARWPYRRAPIARRTTNIHAAPPTITYTATTPTGVRPMLPSSQNVQPLGTSTQTYNSTFGYLEFSGNGAVGFEADFTGDVLSYGWKCQSATLERVMVYVDGQPCMATAATPSVTTATGNFYYVTLTFSGVARRKVEVWVTNTSAQLGIYIPINGAIAPTAQKPRILVVGDSFIGGSAAIADYSKIPAQQLAQMFEANIVMSGLGGTGYAAAGSFVPFGDSTRVAVASGLDPDRIVFLGSVNDDVLTGVQAAASACFAAYKAAAPNASVYAFGPQPSNSTDTISANRAANIAAVKAAAAAQGVTFFDMCGTASGIPAAFNTGTSYIAGDTVTYRGSVWRCVRTAASTYPSGPAGSTSWDVVTYDLYGTGRVGATASDGPRDVLLYSDGVHPTELACGVLAQRLASVLTN